MEMTQEIYNYLWIRNQLLIASIEEINKNNADPEEFEYYIDNLLKIVTKEDIALIAHHIRKKIIDTISKYRFNDTTTPSVKAKINEIIGKMNSYDGMNELFKKNLVNNFFSKEMEDRDAPIIFKNVSSKFTDLAADDYYTYLAMFDIYDGRNGAKLETDFKPSMYQYLAFVNLLLHRFPSVFDIKGFADVMIMNFEKLVDDATPVLTKQDLKYLERTIKKLVKISNDQHTQEKKEKTLEKTN